MGLLDALIFGVRDVFDLNGAQLPRRSRIKFLSVVTDDSINDQLVVASGGSGGSSAAPITNAGTGVLNNVVTSTAGVDADVIRLTGAAPNISGFDAGAGGTRFLLVRALGGAANLQNAGSGSSAANRVFTGTGVDVTLPLNGSALLKRDSTSGYWTLVGIISAAVAIAGNENEILTKVGTVPTGATRVRAFADKIVFDDPSATQVPDGTYGGLIRVSPVVTPRSIIKTVDASGTIERRIINQSSGGLGFGDFTWDTSVLAGANAVLLGTATSSVQLVGRMSQQAVAAPYAPTDQLLTGFPRYGYVVPYGASEGRGVVSAAPPYTLTAAEYIYAEVAFTGVGAGTYTFPTPSGYHLVHYKWLTNNSATTKTISNGSVNTFALASGAQAWVKFSPDGVFGPTSSGSGEANTMSSAGGAASIYKTKSGVDLVVRGVTGGTPVVVTQNTNDITVGFITGTQGQLLRHNGTAWVAGNRAYFISLNGANFGDDTTVVATTGLIRTAYNAGDILNTVDTLGATTAPVINQTNNTMTFGDYRGAGTGMGARLMGNGTTEVDVVAGSVYLKTGSVIREVITSFGILSAKPHAGYFSPYSSHGKTPAITGAGRSLTAAEYEQHKIVFDATSEATMLFPHPASDIDSYFKLVENIHAGTVYISTGTGSTVSLFGTDRKLVEFTPLGVRQALN